MTYKESVLTPYYGLDDTDSDTLVLNWLNDLYLWRCSDREETNRIEKQTTYLALFLNFSPANHRVFNASASGALRVFDRREYYHLIDPVIADIVGSWVARLTTRKPIFSVFPKKISSPELVGQSHTVKSLLNSIFQKANAQELDELNIRNSFVMGESYLELRWDEDRGPLDQDIQNDIDDRGEEALEDLGEASKHIRMGDVGFYLHDPRNVVLQRAKMYDEIEWVDILDVVSTKTLKIRYPEFADVIHETPNPRVYSYDMLSPTYGIGYTLIHRFYHRPNKYVPNGLMMIATENAILEKRDLPSERWIKDQFLPVLQLPDSKVLGSSRGHPSTVMDSCAFGQIALNNLWLEAMTSIAMFSPKLLVPNGSIDLSHLRVGDRNIIVHKKGPPTMMAQEVVSQSHMLMIDKLRATLMKNANVMPVTRGDSMPNVESRKMLDFVKDQQDIQSVPKDTQHNRFLMQWAKQTFNLIADKYGDEDERIIQYFGALNRYETISVTGKDLQIDVDVFVETLNSQATTLQGRMQEIQTILSVVPGFYSPAEIVEQLQIGSPEKVYDEITAASEAARFEISEILSGNDVKSPNKYQDLLTYYDTYCQELQKKEIQALLPENYDPDGTDPGNVLLTQLNTIESLLWGILSDQGQMTPTGPVSRGDLPVLMPHLQLPAGTTLRQYLYGRHPNFPTIFKPQPNPDLNPIAIMQQQQMQNFNPSSPENAMKPSPASPVSHAPTMPTGMPQKPPRPEAASQVSPTMKRPVQQKLGAY